MVTATPRMLSGAGVWGTGATRASTSLTRAGSIAIPMPRKGLPALASITQEVTGRSSETTR